MAESFPWTETADRLQRFMREKHARIERGCVIADGARFEPPLVQAIPERMTSADDYLFSLDASLGLNCVLLVRAGATAIGLWDDDELIAHKVIKKYVVRGSGRAQSTHLKTKGKSRYGSRLRLQNHKRHLEETCERAVDWWESHGAFQRVLYSAPVRLWAELQSVTPELPFDPDSATRIPLHVHDPTFEELKRVRRLLARGRIAPIEE